MVQDVGRWLPAFACHWCRWPGDSCYFADVSKIGQDSAGCLPLGVPTGPEVGGASRHQDLPEVGSGPLVVCSSLFLLCSRCVACKYAFVSRFKGVFSRFPLLDVGLYCFDALRGLWGFCARVELGGFGACGVFAFLFILFAFLFILFAFLLSFCLSFYLFALLLGLCLCCSLACPLVLSFLLCRCIFFFPFGCTDKKKGRNFLRPLLSCCGFVTYLVPP